MAALEERKGKAAEASAEGYTCRFGSAASQAHSARCVSVLCCSSSPQPPPNFLDGGSILTALRSSAEPEVPGGAKVSSCSKCTELAETVKEQKQGKDPKYRFSDIHRHTTTVNCKGRGSCAPSYWQLC